MNRRNGVIAGALAIALLIVIVLWQRDRESKDVKLDIDIGTVAWVSDAARA